MSVNCMSPIIVLFFFFQAEDGIRYYKVTGVQTCALPICTVGHARRVPLHAVRSLRGRADQAAVGEEVDLGNAVRSEEHTSELQSPCNLVCRLLLEKKKKKTHTTGTYTERQC